MDDIEQTDSEFLREISNWIFNNVTPAMGLDQYHSDRLREVAGRLETVDAALTSNGWTPAEEWEDYQSGDDGWNYVRPVWFVEGPAPFGGMRCRDEQHAIDVCTQLNALAGRKPPVESERETKPDPTTEQLAAVMRESGLDVRTSGSTISILGISKETS
jgi:hypothetical protein